MKTKILIIVSLVAMLFSCSTRKEFRNIANAQHDTVYVVNTEFRIDSVWRDRVQYVNIKGDSVYVRDSVFVEKWKLKTLIDTLWKTSYQTITDSVYVEKPSIKHERSRYDIFTSYGFWILLLIDIMALMIFIVCVILKMRNYGN